MFEDLLELTITIPYGNIILANGPPITEPVRSFANQRGNFQLNNFSSLIYVSPVLMYT